MAILRKIKDYINNYISVGMARQRRKFESTHPSPDGKHIIGFAFISEVQMSVWYFGCYIDGRIIKDREFGDICVWSHDGRYFAVQEWLSTNRSRGPDTQILVVDADV
ncbi:MAG: hypothetical protein QGH60_23075, partial [Phycisphaerae bacterium]|nr:hypothetical protein [Phycisphaerae bacterium]